MDKKVYIVVLNYKRWKDTVECLESLYKLKYRDFQIVVVDNCSNDGSIERIIDWASDGLAAPDSCMSVEGSECCATKQNPISYECHNLSGKNVSTNHSQSSHQPLLLMQTGSNLGFAGGNNVGIKYALSRGDCAFVWLLNNDTVVDSTSLHEMVEKFNDYQHKGRKVGMLGTKLLLYNSENILQGVGGTYNKWFGTTKHVGAFETDVGQYDNEETVEAIDYVIGASILICKDFINDVGLLSEDYFLYYEELDWAVRGSIKGWKLGLCFNSKVYHKEGASIGSSSIGSARSEMSDYYMLKSRIIFARKFYPERKWSVYSGFLVVALNRIIRGQFRRLPMLYKILRNRSFWN